MKSFKKSNTSKKINYNSNEIETKKLQLINQKFEETIVKIADYLRHQEQNVNLAKLKEKKKDSTKIFKKKESKDKIDFNNEIFNLEIINYILNKPKKSPDDILIVKTFLSSMSFLSTIKGSFNIDKLLHSLSNYLKMEKKNKDTLIFRYGNKGNKFYVLIRGLASVLILKEIKVQICFKRYFLHLLLLKMIKEDELVKKTITANAKLKFHFDERDFDLYYEKMVNFVNKNMIDIINNKKELEEDDIKEKRKEFFMKKNSIAGQNNFMFNKNNRNMDIKKNNNNNNKRLTVKLKTARNFYQRNKLSSKSLPYKGEEEEKEEGENEEKEINYAMVDLPFFNLNDIKEIIHYYLHLKEKIESKPKNISVKDYINYTYLDSPLHKTLKNEELSKKDDLILFKYFEIIQKKAGESFGELALQKEDNKRTATIITITDCILGILSRNDYNSCLGDYEAKKRKNDINFIMSFSIFDKMNRIVFENRFFNFFTKENFVQGKEIIIQENKVDKVFFIMEGQFEIMTNLSLLNIYNLIYQKLKKKIPHENIMHKFPKEEYNLRLYISYNKDILGLEDCCFENNVSFITAKCLSDNGCAFTIKKSMLNEIRHKIPEIDYNIIKIKDEREKVMIDRLKNIYKRIIQSRNKSKKNNFNETQKTQDSFKYINYFFGINQGNKNNKVKTYRTKVSHHKRVRSALLLSMEKKTLKTFNEGELFNSSIPDKILTSRISSQRKINDTSKQTEDFQKEEIIPKKEIKINNNIDEKDNLVNSLKVKISEVIDSSLSKTKSNEQNIIVKQPNKLNENNNDNNQEKDFRIKSAINRIKVDEYSRFYNWIDSHKSSTKRISQQQIRNNRIIKHKSVIKRNSSEIYFSSFNKSRRKISIKSRPYSSINDNNKILIQKENNSAISRNISNFKSSYYKEIKIPNIPYLKSFYKNRSNKRRTSRAISPDLKSPRSIKGDLDAEKFLKKLLGTRYRDQFISYEEQKFNKLIENYDLQMKFLSKSKKAKINLKIEKIQKGFIKHKEEYKKINKKLRNINYILKN